MSRDHSPGGARLREEPDALHRGLLEGVSFDPVFIMGDHRSGTTLLYQVLETTGCFNVVQAYHIVHRDSLLAHCLDGADSVVRERLTADLRGEGQQNRIIDGVPVSAELPEEYGFLLDDSPRPRLTPRNLARFVLFCEKVKYVSEAGKPLLLKNPWDYMNFGYVKQAFPNARFIFMHRHPAHVISSQIKAIRTLTGERSPYMALLSRWYASLHNQPVRLAVMRGVFSPRFNTGYRIACRHVRKATRYFLDHIDEVPSGDITHVRYEDLCGDASGTVRKILAFLGLRDGSGQDYREQIQPRTARLCPEVERGRAAIHQLTRAYCERFEYGVGDDPVPQPAGGSL